MAFPQRRRGTSRRRPYRTLCYTPPSSRGTAEREWRASTRRLSTVRQRATLGVFQPTPLSIVAAESGLIPTRALLDHRQARFAQQLLARPREQRPEILARRGSALAHRLRTSTFIQAGESAEDRGGGGLDIPWPYCGGGEEGGPLDSREVGRIREGESGRVGLGWMMGWWGRQRRSGRRPIRHRPGQERTRGPPISPFAGQQARRDVTTVSAKIRRRSVRGSTRYSGPPDL